MSLVKKSATTQCGYITPKCVHHRHLIMGRNEKGYVTPTVLGVPKRGGENKDT